jgi:hypothetical protein
MMDMSLDTTNSSLSRSVVRSFYMHLAGPDFFSELDATASTLPVVLQPVAGALRQNLAGVISTVSVPATLAGAAAASAIFQQFHFAETLRQRAAWIRAGGSGSGPLPEPYSSAAAQLAQKKLADETVARDRVVDAAFGSLGEALKSAEMVDAADELLRQGLVLTWGSFEVAARDTLKQYLNVRPADVLPLVRQPETRKIIQLRGLDFDVLAQHGFDISRSMGDILVSQNDFSRLSAVRELSSVLFSADEALRKTLGSRKLWLLNQMRHLIVHQRGIVDKRFIDSTGNTAQLGDRLLTTPDELEEFLELVRDAGLQLLASAGRALADV